MKKKSELNWHILDLSEISLMQKTAENNDFNANNYSAINSFLYQEKYSSKISFNNGWIFERYEHCGKFCYSFPHNIDGNNSEIFDALDLIYEESFANPINETLFFHNVTEEEKDLLAKYFEKKAEEDNKIKIFIQKDDSSSDYIYLKEMLENLPGSKYSKKRNHINQFKKKHPDYFFQKITENNLNLVLEIEEKWLEESLKNNSEEDSAQKTSKDLQTEKKIIEKAVNNFSFFKSSSSLDGGILFVEGKASAFCISSKLSSSVTDIHFEKCLSEIAKDGGYAIINNEFAKTLETKYINREEDLGIPGLRKAKLSYYPEIILVTCK